MGEYDLIREVMTSVKVPSRHDRVYKDECMFSFDTPETPTGLYTSLTTWQSFGADYVESDYQRNGNRLYLKQVWKRIISDEEATENSEVGGSDAAPSKMAIGVEGGFNVDQPSYSKHTKNYIVVFPQHMEIEYPNECIPTIVSTAVDAILAHDGFRRATELTAAWEEEERRESKYAKDLPQLDNGKLISPDPKTWRCEESGMTENLWLNLSTGHVGSGRRNWDGSGGTGAAQKHFEETGKKYPLVVKLGTITPQGADVFSYAEEENDMVIDPQLSKHLAHWGINMQLQEKTEKTIAELQIELNSNYNFNRITESGSNLVRLHGPGYVGLENLGNSCYMSSVMQIMFSVPEVAARFKDKADSIFHSAPADPSEDLLTMMAKLGVGLLSDRYTKPVPMYQRDPEKEGKLILANKRHDDEYGSIRPFMFKNVIGKGHIEFSSGRQQDASEFFQHFLDRMIRAERAGRQRVLDDESADKFTPLAALFGFETEDRLQDSQTNKVKYMSRTDNLLSLSIDVNDAVNKKQYEDFDEQSKKRPKYEDGIIEVPVQLKIPLTACLERFAEAEVITNFKSPETGLVGSATKRTRFKTFPEYLAVHLKRYYLDEKWTPKKLDVSVPMPMELDLGNLRATGLQDGEVLLEEPGNDGSAGTNQASGVVPDVGIVRQLMDMGFSENGSKRAAIATNNASAQASMEWVFEHMSDSNFNDPIEAKADSASEQVSQNGTAFPAEATSTLTAMGFTDLQAKAALTAVDGSLERAADWLFSHADGIDAAVREVLAENDQPNVSSGNGIAETMQHLDGEPRYELMGFSSHLGNNTSCGHYVAHIRKEGRFVLFNDSKVAVSKTPPTDLGFLYVYRRKR